MTTVVSVLSGILTVSAPKKSSNHAGFRAFLTGLTVFLIPVQKIKSSVWNVKDNKKGERKTLCGNEVQITVSSVRNPSKSQ